jgi:hypothetical protein
MNSPYPDVAIGCDTSPPIRTFNIDIAETMLLFSAIMYERDQSLVRKAHEIIADISKNPEKATPDNYANVSNVLKESEKRIHDQARIWDVQFTSLSELNSFGGPFAGMFWCHEHNFIVIAFKV